MTTPLAEQIACVEREIATMKSVLATLRWLQAHEDKIKRRVEG